ncbi:phage major capsid protein [Listeria fleischmannii]|uniref:phage major capsid protein n=1 Tax=Listeria fleischmannii TaxID=1069827 RepID=UPI0016276293|nr:phage major capsid protein [Listeria fleischmannii]MBC1420108.1 phage major capsid protein [Listeria fleischmannii]
MTVKLNKEKQEQFNQAKQDFINSIQNGESQEAQGEAYSKMLDSLQEGLMADAREAAREEAELYSATTSADSMLTAAQRKFYNEINTNVGTKDETLLPQETVDRIFEDMTTEHPLLSKIGLKNAGLRLKFLASETTGVAVWGKIFDEIKGQLDATFSEEESISSKLTAFVVIPKDLKDFGPAWIERFVRLQIEEAFSVALEIAFLTGDGQDKPIGLDRDINSGTVTGGVTTYPKKTAKGTLTFADSKTTIKELTSVFKYHSVKENGKALAVAGKVVLVVNPADAWDVKTQYTFLNANGTYVTALPYNLDIVESEAQAEGEVLTFVTGRYDAYLGGGINVKQFDQTLALEDLDLYVAKQFVYGCAKDIKASAIWTLNIADTVPEA